MGDLVPSYLRKISRAETHLQDLKAIIADYIEGRPHVLTKDAGDPSGPYRIRTTSGVPPEVSLISGDFIYNVRSALDHLAAALNPPNRKRSVYFPIFWKGVWEPHLESEDHAKANDRNKWISSTRKMAPEAIEILKRLQPTMTTKLVVRVRESSTTLTGSTCSRTTTSVRVPHRCHGNWSNSDHLCPWRRAYGNN